MYSNRVEWRLMNGGPNYVSACGKYVATYLRTERGQGCFMVHATTIPLRARKQSNAQSIGGLPSHAR